MDEQAKQLMRQAVEHTKQRIAREREKAAFTPVVSLVVEQEEKSEDENKLITIADSYPVLLFKTLPHKYSTNPDELCYPCPTCGDVPGLIRRSNGYGRRACRCVREEKEREDAQRFQEYLRQERLSVPVKERVTYTWLGMDYGSLAEHSLKNFERELQPEAFNLVSGYVRQVFRRETPLDNILIYGAKAGVGKTHLACAILNYCYEKGYSCLFCTAKDYFDALWACDFRERVLFRQRVGKTDVFLCDDIDKADPKDPNAQKQEFFQLLNVRYEAGRPTIFTANSSDLSRWFNEWTISRVQERLLRIPVAGKDYREIRAQRARKTVNAVS